MTRTYNEDGSLEISGSDLSSIKLVVDEFDVSNISDMAARRIAVAQHHAKGLSLRKAREAAKTALASSEMKSIVRAALARGASAEQAIHYAMKASGLKVVNA